MRGASFFELLVSPFELLLTPDYKAHPQRLRREHQRERQRERRRNTPAERLHRLPGWKVMCNHFKRDHHIPSFQPFLPPNVHHPSASE